MSQTNTATKRTNFFERSGLPFWNAYYEIGKKKIYYPYIPYQAHKESESLIKEMQEATVKVAEVFDLVAPAVKELGPKDLEKWGFHKDYGDLLTAPWDEIFCMRVGWGWQKEQLKFFEINSQTPSFWYELENGTEILTKEFKLRNPNPLSLSSLKQSLNQAIKKRIPELPSERRYAPVVGFVTCNYWEDVDTMRWLSTFCEYDFQVLHIENLDFTRDENIPYNRETNVKLDLLVFWYPIEWIEDMQFQNGDFLWNVLMDGLNNKTFLMPHAVPAFFLQPKSILAYITENAPDIFTGIYKEAEKYFPKTYMKQEQIIDNFIAKPLWGREGRGSFIQEKGKILRSRYQEDYYVKQPKVYQELLSLPKITLDGQELTAIYEAWTYRVDGKFVPGGIGIRGSEHVITDDYCYFIPVGI